MGRYVVTAPSRVLGHEPGSEFDADIAPKQEASLLRIGAIKALTELRHLKRTELDRLAGEAGIEHPEQLDNKQAVIDAINAQNTKEGESDG